MALAALRGGKCQLEVRFCRDWRVPRATWAVGEAGGSVPALQWDPMVALWLLWDTTQPRDEWDPWQSSSDGCGLALKYSHLYKLYKSSPRIRECAHKYVDSGSSPHDLFTSSIILFLTSEQFLETVHSSN